MIGVADSMNAFMKDLGFQVTGGDYRCEASYLRAFRRISFSRKW